MPLLFLALLLALLLARLVGVLLLLLLVRVFGADGQRRLVRADAGDVVSGQHGGALHLVGVVGQITWVDYRLRPSDS